MHLLGVSVLAGNHATRDEGFLELRLARALRRTVSRAARRRYRAGTGVTQDLSGPVRNAELRQTVTRTGEIFRRQVTGKCKQCRKAGGFKLDLRPAKRALTEGLYAALQRDPDAPFAREKDSLELQGFRQAQELFKTQLGPEQSIADEQTWQTRLGNVFRSAQFRQMLSAHPRDGFVAIFVVLKRTTRATTLTESRNLVTGSGPVEVELVVALPATYMSIHGQPSADLRYAGNPGVNLFRPASEGVTCLPMFLHFRELSLGIASLREVRKPQYVRIDWRRILEEHESQDVFVMNDGEFDAVRSDRKLASDMSERAVPKLAKTIVAGLNAHIRKMR